MSDALSPDQLNAILRSISLLRSSSYVTVSIAACFVCDIVFSFGEEVTLVWPSRWSLTKGLYFYNRYSPFVDIFVVLALVGDQPSPESCYVRNEIMAYLIIIGTAVSEGIIMMRTLALWDRNKIVLWLFLFMIIGIPVANIVNTNIFFKALKYGPSPSSVLTGCFATHQGNLLWISFLLFLVMESVVVSLTLYKGFDHVQHVKTRLVFTLYEDGLMYYLFFFVVTLANIVLYFAGPPELLNTLTLPSRVIHSILATHVILRIRACMRDRQLRQAGRPVGSTWVPAQYTGELDESFSADGPVLGQRREYDVEDGSSCVDASTESKLASDSSDRDARSVFEDDRGEGSSKLADSIANEDSPDVGARAPRGNVNVNSCPFSFVGQNDDDKDGAPFSFTSITFADPPYDVDDFDMEYGGTEADVDPAIHICDTPSDFRPIATKLPKRPSSFWSSVKGILISRRADDSLHEDRSEVLTELKQPSPLPPKRSIELEPLPSFA